MILYNIILQTTPRSFPWRPSDYNFVSVCFSHFYYKECAAGITVPDWLAIAILGGIQSREKITVFSPSSYYFCFIRSTYILQHFASTHLFSWWLWNKYIILNECTSWRECYIATLLTPLESPYITVCVSDDKITLTQALFLKKSYRRMEFSETILAWRDNKTNLLENFLWMFIDQNLMKKNAIRLHP